MSTQTPKDPTPLSIDDLDDVVGGAGSGAPPSQRRPRPPGRQDDFDAIAGAAAVAAHPVNAVPANVARAALTQSGVHVVLPAGEVHIPHPAGGDAASTLHGAAAHLEQVHTEVTAASASAGASARHPVLAIMGRSWTQGH